MERFLERDEEFENDGFAEDSTLKPAQRRNLLRPSQSLNRFVEPQEEFNVIKPRPWSRSELTKAKELDEFDSDDGNWGTIKRKPNNLRPKITAGLDNSAFAQDEFEDGFDFDDRELKLKVPLQSTVQCGTNPKYASPTRNDGFSDFETCSPSRHSHTSSATSLSDFAENLDEDDGFDFEAGPNDLVTRFKAREVRARIENTSPAGKQSRRTGGPGGGPGGLARGALALLQHDDSEDDFGGVDLNAFDPTRAKNVVYGSIKLPTRSFSRQDHMLRPSSSFARDDLAAARPPNSASARRTIRPAKSMYEIAQRAKQEPMARLNTQFSRLQPSASTRRMRDLAQYAEPEIQRPVKHSSTQTTSKGTSLSGRRRRNIGLIRNAHSGLEHKQSNGMVLDPVSGLWLGNEADGARFDAVYNPKTVRIPHSQTTAVGGMVFDAANLCWMPASGTLDDPFSGMDDLDESRFRAVSNFTASTEASHLSSSIRTDRSELASRDTFEVSAVERRAWHESDQRFTRKFGRWISGEGELNAAAYDIYKMVR